MPVLPSTFFPFHPFANIGSTVLKLDALRFALRKKKHYFASDYVNVFQIQNNVWAILLAFKKLPQLGYRLFFDSAAQDENAESPSRGGLNSESH
jgi:hypothetical protein